jgi:hypothetical protein
MTEQEYYDFFMGSISADASVSSNFTEEAFVEMMCKDFVEKAVIPNFEIIMHRYETPREKEKVSAWHVQPEEGKLFLIVSGFTASPQIEIANQDMVDKYLKLAKRFYTQLRTRKALEKYDPTTSAYEAAVYICDHYEEISRVNIVLITNAKLGTRVKIASDKEKDVVIDYDIWDIGRIHLMNESEMHEVLEINLGDFNVTNGLPFLAAFEENRDANLRSYLSVVPGELLSNLYAKYGERLLEQNVRTFLQFQGANKGIRNTIRNNPEMFFCYNNGITTTAEEVGFSEDNNRIVFLKNFQIVNGGQTTASIFTTKRNDRSVDLSKVFVQMKLTIVPPELVDKIVPDISQFSNTQNKVNTADFTSNHPFHRRIEMFSRGLTFHIPGKTVYWYYERSRGQYGNALAKLTGTDLKTFLSMNPKSRMFKKTDLAKAEFSFRQLPYIVSKGQVECYKEFAKEMIKEWEVDPNGKKCNKLYFKKLTAKLLIYNSIDSAIAKSDWYVGDFKSQLRTYSVAYLMFRLSKVNMCLNLSDIAKRQEAPPVIVEYLLMVSATINSWFATFVAQNIGTLCKQKHFWDRMKIDIDLKLPGVLRPFLISLEDEIKEDLEAQREVPAITGIEEQTDVVRRGDQYWLTMMEFMRANNLLLDHQEGILAAATNMTKRVPSPDQCKVILKLEKLAIREGFSIK